VGCRNGTFVEVHHHNIMVQYHTIGTTTTTPSTSTSYVQDIIQTLTLTIITIETSDISSKTITKTNMEIEDGRLG
jgi:predicted Abi (CAAX) family protease